MNIPMYKDEEEILVHPERVEWMEQAGWSTEPENETDNEVIENGSNNGA